MTAPNQSKLEKMDTDLNIKKGRNRHAGKSQTESPPTAPPQENTRPNSANRIDTRIAQLKAEFEAGQKMLTDLDEKRNDLTQTMLRISGGIQVLEEMRDMPHEEPPEDSK